MKATERFILPCGAVYHVVQGGSKFESVDEILSGAAQMKATEQYFITVAFVSFLSTKNGTEKNKDKTDTQCAPTCSR